LGGWAGVGGVWGVSEGVVIFRWWYGELCEL
jgi:hypothetical protein